MPTTSKPLPKRKAPTSKSTKTTTAPRRKSAPTGKRGRPSFIADQASASDDDEDAEEDENDSDDDEFPSSNPRSASADDSDTSIPSTARGPTTTTQDAPPTIPPALLTRLLHHHFKDSKIRIGKEANGAVGRYMETFVREAIARAAFERSEAVAEGRVEAGVAGEFLEVSSLLCEVEW